MAGRTLTSLFTVAALASALIPAPALASSPPPPTLVFGPAPAPAADEVLLVSGGFIRGEIVDYVPGSHVTIVPKGTTEARRVAWSDISEVVRGGSSTPAPTPGDTPSPAPGPAPAPEPAPEPGPEPSPAPAVEPTPSPEPAPSAEPEPEGEREGAVVHINQTGHKEQMILYRVDGEAYATSGGYTAHAIAYSEICESPCDVVLEDTGGEFFVNGQKKYSGSARFRLPGNHSRYDLDIRTGSRGVRIGGYVTMVSAIVAASFMAAGPFLVDMPKRPNAVGTWAGAGLVGAFGIGGGIAMMILGRSKVTVHPSGKR